MKRRWVILLCLMLGLTLAACGSKESAKTLSLDQVIILSEKGLSLSWNDFEDYQYEETSTKPYIRDYPLQEEEYSLFIRGNSLKESPLNIYLVNKYGEIIDIRTDDIVVFLGGVTQDNSAPEPDSSSTPASAPPASSSQAPVYTDQALQDYLTYLKQGLTDDQHGGMYRESDYNGSGKSMHGGSDRADPYIVIWAIDQKTIVRVAENYAGPKVDIVYIDAVYSMKQLNAIADELRNSEIAPLTNGVERNYGIFVGGNRVVLDVIGDSNKTQIDKYLQSYENKNAIFVSYRSENAENPTT